MNEQNLAPSIGVLLEGIYQFRDAGYGRLSRADEWTPEHLDTIADLINDLTKLEIRLRRLEAGTR